MIIDEWIFTHECHPCLIIPYSIIAYLTHSLCDDSLAQSKPILIIQQLMKANCGCYGKAIDLIALDESAIELPLLKNTYDIQILNGVAQIELSQTYLNHQDVFLQVQYQLPISPNACLHKFAAIFSKLRLQGVVKEIQSAKTQYQEAVKQGKRAVLASIDQKRADLLILKIGNMAPGEEVKIEMSFTEQLSLSLNTFYRFDFLTELSPSYANSFSQSDYQSAFRNKAKLSRGTFEWDFKLRLKAHRKIVSYHSTSHKLVVECANDQNTEIFLTLQKGESLTKSFSILYTTEQFQIPSYTLGRTDAGSSVMISFIPKFCSLQIKDAEAAAAKGENITEVDFDSVRGQYIFLLDRSGSMGGETIEKAKQALILFLKSLPVDTYFQVISFGTSYDRMFDQSRKNSNESIQFAVQSIQKMKANMGGTQIYLPLRESLSNSVIKGYPKQIFLLTDGEVGNVEKVLQLVKCNVKYSRVHSIGVGNDVSRELIVGCAKNGKGYHIFIANQENPSQKIIQLLNDSLTPVISKIDLTYDQDIVESIVPNPNKLPYILKGQTVNFYFNFKGHLSKPTSIALSYTDSHNQLTFKSQVQILPQSSAQSFVDKMANFRRIRALQQAEGANENAEDYIYFVKAVEKKQQIIELSVKTQIISKYTAFICVQKQLVDGKYQEIKTKGQKLISTPPIPLLNYPHHDLLSTSSLPSSYSNKPFGVMLMSSPPPPPPPNLPSIPPPPPPNLKPSNFGLPPPPIANQSLLLNFQKQNNGSQPFPLLPPPPPMDLGGLAPPPQKLSTNFADFFGPLKSIPPPMPPQVSLKNVSPPQLSFNAVPPQASFKTAPLHPPASQPLNVAQMEKKKTFNNLFGIGGSLTESASLKSESKHKPTLIQNDSLSPPSNQLASNTISFSQCMIEKRPGKANLEGLKISPNLSKLQIEQIIKQQQFDGKWINVVLIQKIYGLQLSSKVQNQPDRNLIVTLLITKWLEKQGEAQYLLIVKKALSWLKKQSQYKYYTQVYEAEWK